MNKTNFSELLKNTIKVRNKNNVNFKKLNDGQIHWVDVDSIHFKDNYKSTYSQKEAKVKLLEDSLKHGFDPVYPLIVSEDGAIEEGNSRYTACLNVGIKSVPIIVKRFSSDSETVNWQRDRQGSSRQLDDAEIYEQFIYYETLKKQKNTDDEDATGFSNQNLAEALNVSPRLVSTFRFIYEHSSEEELKEYLCQLKNNEITFNKIEKTIKERESPTSVNNKKEVINPFKLGVKFAIQETMKGISPFEIWMLADLGQMSPDGKILFSEQELKKIGKNIKTCSSENSKLFSVTQITD